MPWTPRDAYRHTKKASTPRLQKQWADVANSALASGDDEAAAIRQANSVVGRSGTRGRGAAKAAPKAASPKPVTRTSKR